MLAVTACPNGIAHTYMAAEALTKMGDKLGLPTKVETARFDGKPVLFARVDDGIHKPEELIKKIAHGETPIYHAEAGAKTRQAAGGPFGWCLPKTPRPLLRGALPAAFP